MWVQISTDFRLFLPVTLQFSGGSFTSLHIFIMHSEQGCAKGSWWWLHLPEPGLVLSIVHIAVNPINVSMESGSAIKISNHVVICGFAMMKHRFWNSKLYLLHSNIKMFTDTWFVLWREIPSYSQIAMRLLPGLNHAGQCIRNGDLSMTHFLIPGVKNSYEKCNYLQNLFTFYYIQIPIAF